MACPAGGCLLLIRHDVPVLSLSDAVRAQTTSAVVRADVPGASLGAAARNLVLSGLGNLVGGGVFVAGAYLLASRVDDAAAQALAQRTGR